MNINRNLLVVGALLAFSTQAGAQVLSVGSPFRGDNLLAPGASATIKVNPAAESMWLASAPLTFADEPLPYEMAGVTITIGDYPARIWCVYRQSIQFIVPPELQIGHRQSSVGLRLTTVYGSYSLAVRIASTAPGLAQDGQGHLAGLWQIGNNQPHWLLEPIKVTKETMLALIVSGLGSQNGPETPQDSILGQSSRLYVVIGSRQIPAISATFGYPGLYWIGCLLPADLPTGRYEIRVKAGRGWSEQGMWLEFVQ